MTMESFFKLSFSPNIIGQYIIAFSSVLVALLARLTLDPLLGDQLPFFTFYCAIGISAWYGGLGPSLVAILLGGFAADWFFIPPRFSFLIEGTAQTIGYTAYLVAGLVIVALGQAWRSEVMERRRAEASLKADLETLTRMHAISRIRVGTEGPNPIFDEIIQTAVVILGATKGTLQLLEGNNLKIVAHHGHEPSFLDFFSKADMVTSACGEAATRGERIVIADVERHPFFQGTPSLEVLREAGVRAVQSTPLITRTGRLVGILTTHWLVPHRPNNHDLWRLDLLARQAADMIESGIAEEALRQGEERLRRFAGQLEQLVDERTRELVRSQEQLRTLATELTLTEQRERQRLATELHDHLQQLLVLCKLRLGQGKRLAAGSRDGAKIMREVDETITHALAYSRSLVAELSPPVLREHGIGIALKWLGDWMKTMSLSVSVDVDEHEQVPLAEAHEVLLFQSVRELLINAAKYSGTGRASVRLTLKEGQLQIDVQDDGAGFDVASTLAVEENASSPKFGLFSIRERMRALGGAFTIESTPGRGTKAVLTLPVKHQPAADKIRVMNDGSGSAAKLKPQPTSTVPTVSDSSPVRVLLVDDHAMVRQGLRSVLESYRSVDVVGEAQDGEEAVELVEKVRPDVVVMDISMPKMSGIEATAQIKTRYPDTVVIGLSVNATGQNNEAMKRSGATLILTKEAAVENLYAEIVQAVQLV